ncbi:MAG: site-specific integrase [Thermoleophilaceae bacterium]
MATKLEKTTTPGIFRRHKSGCGRNGRCECSYVVPRPTMQTFGTFAEAREGKAAAARRAKLSKGHAAGLHRDQPREECPDCERERAERERAEPTLHEYAREWVERYQGTGRRGFREETRHEYRSRLNRYALRHFEEGVRLSDVAPRDVADLIGWLVKQPNGKGGTLSDKSVRNALAPLTACLATARREGLIPHNPALGAALPHRPRVEDDDDAPRPFPRFEDDGETVETMELVVALAHPGHRVMFELLAATGVRRSELIAFEGRHLALDGDRPYVRVRQRAVRRTGEGMVIGALKSRYARRDLPIPIDLADRLRALGTASDALVFESPAGGAYDTHHLHQRVLAPACSEAGVEWAGFHTFRHTVASRMFAAGRSVVAVQRWLGHHSPSFTLDTYVHLLDADLGDPLEPLRGQRLDRGHDHDLARVHEAFGTVATDNGRVNARSTERPETAANVAGAEIVETLD